MAALLADTTAQRAPVQVLLRVSEHMPEIVAYVEAIQANGFAYQASGSVYFDTQAFRHDSLLFSLPSSSLESTSDPDAHTQAAWVHLRQAQALGRGVCSPGSRERGQF